MGFSFHFCNAFLCKVSQLVTDMNSQLICWSVMSVVFGLRRTRGPGVQGERGETGVEHCVQGKW